MKNPEFIRFDMSKFQKDRYYRSLKLDKRNWHKELNAVTLEIIEDMRDC